MYNNSSVIITWIAFIFAILSLFVTIKDNISKKKQPKTETKNYKQLRAKFINSDITTNVIVFKTDTFKTNDTVLVQFNDVEQYLEVIYQVNPNNGLPFNKVVIQ